MAVKASFAVAPARRIGSPRCVDLETLAAGKLQSTTATTSPCPAERRTNKSSGERSGSIPLSISRRRSPTIWAANPPLRVPSSVGTHAQRYGIYLFCAQHNYPPSQIQKEAAKREGGEMCTKPPNSKNGNRRPRTKYVEPFAVLFFFSLSFHTC